MTTYKRVRFFLQLSLGLSLVVAIIIEPVAAPLKSAPEAPKPTEDNRFGFTPNKGLNIITLDDLPPMIAKRAKWLQTERQKNGYRVTTDAEIDRYTLRNMQKAFVPIEKIEKKFTAKIGKPINEGAFGGDMVLEGFIPANRLSGAVIYGISRIYTLNDKSFLMVKEVDLDSGIKVAFPAEAINENVNGYPAMLNVSKTKTGKVLTSLTWVTDQKLFIVTKASRESKEVVNTTNGQLNKLIEFSQTLE